MRFLFFVSLFLPQLLSAACPFCNPEIVDRQCITTTEKSMLLYCLTPATDGNLLAIPKRHITRFEELNDEELKDLFQLIEKTQRVFQKNCGRSDYLIVQKNGKNAGQSVDHIHLHVIPCPDDFDPKVVFLYRPPISRDEMKEKVAEFKSYFERLEEIP